MNEDVRVEETEAESAESTPSAAAESDSASNLTASAGDQTPGTAEAADAPPAEAAPKPAGKKKPKQQKAAPPPDPRVESLRAKVKNGESVSGKVIGWNKGGFHVVVDGLTAFCPHSEMETGHPRSPQGYVDQEFDFRILRVRSRGRQIVLSRARLLRDQQQRERQQALQQLEVGGRISGKVVSLTEFGAFIELGGVQGLVHRSEISRRQIADPAEVLEVGQEVDVQILKIEKGGQRISLSMRALEPDPWREAAQRFKVGTTVEGRVERTASFGAFIELEPGLTGLLPTAAMGLPAESIPARAFPPGKPVRVQIQSIDPRRRRISLIREGAQMGGSDADFRAYRERQKKESGSGFQSLASALSQLQRDKE